jgi:hypothetical protein
MSWDIVGFARRAGLEEALMAALARVRKITRGPKPVRRLRALAWISHANERIGAPNQRELLCCNDFALIRGEPRCRQSVAQKDLILEP